ncbi:MAG: glycosyltransferase [Clostridiales bacterium]|nr:glycosyltransferase [Clostridiales bacterium]
MPDIDLSVIVPVKNVESCIDDIVSDIKCECAGLRFEIIITDLNSTDNSVGAAFDALENNSVSGTVIRCGSDVPGCALNSGIDRSRGKYITFVFPRKMYVNCISDYYKDIENKNAEFAFAPAPFDCKKGIILTDKSSFYDIFDGIMYGKASCDIASVMISSDFLKENGICFSETLTYGYSDDFITKMLIKCKNIAVSSAKPERKVYPGAPKSYYESITESMRLDRLEAAVDLIKSASGDDEKHIRIKKMLCGQKIPSLIFNCIDGLLSDNYTVSAIKSVLKSRNYDIYLRPGKLTSPKLKQRILLWRLAPFLYKK